VRIAIDASRAGRLNPTGTERYARNVLNALVPIAGHHWLSLYYDRQPADPPRAPHVEVKVRPFPRLWTHVRLSVEMGRERPDRLFVPAHVVPAVHPPTVVTIHDLGYLRYRLAYRPAAWIYLFLSTRWSARVAARIVVDSWATRRDLLRHTGVDPAKVEVVHLGVEPRFHPREPAELAEPLARLGLKPGGYLLFVGTLQPRKNLPRIMRAHARAGKDVPPLAIAGAGSLPTTSDRTRLLGYVPDELGPALYAGARGLVFPTLYEGFGLPLLEAMASGVPVLGGDNSSMPEIVGDAGLLVDATDEAAIADGIRRLCGGDSDLKAKGLARARQFTWERTAAQTLAAIERPMSS